MQGSITPVKFIYSLGEKVSRRGSTVGKDCHTRFSIFGLWSGGGGGVLTPVLAVLATFLLWQCQQGVESSIFYGNSLNKI